MMKKPTPPYMLMLIILISFMFISMSYAGYTDTIQITGTATTQQDFNEMDLVGYWKFDEASGTTAFDSSAYNNDGNLIGATPLGEYYDFDGENDYVSMPDDESLDVTDQITVMAWVKFDSLESGRFYTIVGKWNDVDGNYRGYLLGLSNLSSSKPQPRFYISTNGNNYPSANSALNLDTGIWYHLAGTYDNNDLKIYVNGVLKGSYSLAGETINQNNQPVLIAGDRAGGSNARFYDGNIDEVRIYETALSANEIQYIYNEENIQHT